MLFRSARYTLHSPLPPDVVRRRLAERHVPSTPFRPRPLPSADRLVRGRVGRQSFSITRPIAYRNSMQTLARGRFEADGEGTQVVVSMGLHPLIRLFVGLFLLVEVVWLAVSLADWLRAPR